VAYKITYTDSPIRNIAPTIIIGVTGMKVMMKLRIARKTRGIKRYPSTLTSPFFFQIRAPTADIIKAKMKGRKTRRNEPFNREFST
jgi:hypothetical protein